MISQSASAFGPLMTRMTLSCKVCLIVDCCCNFFFRSSFENLPFIVGVASLRQYIRKRMAKNPFSNSLVSTNSYRSPWQQRIHDPHSHSYSCNYLSLSCVLTGFMTGERIFFVQIIRVKIIVKSTLFCWFFTL